MATTTGMRMQIRAAQYGLSVTDIAHFCGVPAGLVEKWFRDQLPPKGFALHRFCLATECSEESIINDSASNQRVDILSVPESVILDYLLSDSSEEFLAIRNANNLLYRSVRLANILIQEATIESRDLFIFEATSSLSSDVVDKGECVVIRRGYCRAYGSFMGAAIIDQRFLLGAITSNGRGGFELWWQDRNIVIERPNIQLIGELVEFNFT
ncbi:hypothetical protein [Microbulbifer sp. ARAS458-1]|uniref:hypothetical protein n=1 Tax=Microbulbifer sp. ARAS458-1 TaxID=3140242 RepID=UPI003877C52C